MAKKLPKTYLKLKERDKAYIDAVEALGRAVKEAGPLDEKTAQLIQLAAAAAIRSEGSVHSHVRRALEAGATTEEVRHALILLTSTIGFPTVAAALTWAGDWKGPRPSEPWMVKLGMDAHHGYWLSIISTFVLGFNGRPPYNRVGQESFPVPSQ
jgi:AhpD family alkylhydroperoxidase